jgi:glycosyltransferase involved in cell wall biosynthesis
MTMLVKEEHEKIIERNINGSYIFPLPIDIAKYRNLKRVPLKNKIVSIGRLTDFKTYNILLLNVIKKLVENGFNVNYHIYGDGDEMKRIKHEIKRLNLINFVFLHGTIDYDKISDIFSDAYLFIGMGTSAIESGVSGIPTIVAIAYDKESETHGLIHELPNFNSGELIMDYPKIHYFNVIQHILSLSELEYKKLCKVSSSILSSQYDIDVLMPNFLNYVDELNSQVIEFPKIRIPILYILNQTCRHFWNKSKSILKKFIK